MAIEIKLNGTALSIAVPVLVSIVAGAFFVGLHINSARVDHFKELVREYERSSQLDAPGLVRSIDQSAKALQLSSSERQAFDAAKDRVDEYAVRIGSCEATLENAVSTELELRESLAKSQMQCSDAVRSLREELASYVAEESEIVAKVGTAAEVIRNNVMLGVQSIYATRAVINLNSSTVFINVGESTGVRTEGRQCNLWLSKVDTSKHEATFRLVCPTAD